jgi:hypothetical protein
MSPRPIEILEEIHNDSRFDGIFDRPGVSNISRLFELREEAIVGYYHKPSLSGNRIGARGRYSDLMISKI